MSMRAYRINKIEIGYSTFNLWNDQGITEWLGRNGRLEELNTDGAGMLELTIDELKDIIDEVKDLSAETKNKIEDDIKYAMKNGESSVRYIIY